MLNSNCFLFDLYFKLSSSPIFLFLGLLADFTSSSLFNPVNFLSKYDFTKEKSVFCGHLRVTNSFLLLDVKLNRKFFCCIKNKIFVQMWRGTGVKSIYDALDIMAVSLFY